MKKSSDNGDHQFEWRQLVEQQQKWAIYQEKNHFDSYPPPIFPNFPHFYPKVGLSSIFHYLNTNHSTWMRFYVFKQRYDD